MDPDQCIVRRANVDDLEGLKKLWERAGMPVLEMERRLTEFQLVSDMDGDLKGVAALRVQGKNALLHDEAFVRPEEEDIFRPMLWERLKTLAKNHGVARVWTREEAPFWHREAGFADAGEEVMKKLPDGFGEGRHHWLCLTLREEAGDTSMWEKEFEVFQMASRAGMEERLAKAKRIRLVLLVVGLTVFFLGTAVVAIEMIRSRRKRG